MSDDIEIQKTIRRLTRRYNAPGHELVNDDGPAAVAIIEALVKQRDEAIGAFNNLAIESKALTYFNRAEKAEAEVERLKGVLGKIADGDVPRDAVTVWRSDGVHSKHDKCGHERVMYDDCGNCISDFARKALEAKP